MKMLATSTMNQNFENNVKPKKRFRKIKNKSNNQNNPSDRKNDVLKKDISAESTTNLNEKCEKINFTQNNKECSFLTQTSREKDTKTLIKGEPFVTTSKDFPELKVHNYGNLSIFNSINNSKMEYNKLWGSIQKNKACRSLPPVNINAKVSKEVRKTVGNSNAGLCDISKKQCKTPLNIENVTEKEVISVQNIPVQSKRNPNKKKRADPVVINMYDILNVNKTKTRTRPQRIFKSKFLRHKDAEQLSGNHLDSSNPKRLRGKHRAVKKRTLTNLKLTIIKERIIKQKLREKSISAYFKKEDINFIDNIDFKTEVKIYLKELNEKKLKQADVTQNKDNKNSNSENNKKEVNSCEKKKKMDKTIPSITPEGKFKFSSKFREYCDNIITPDFNLAVCNLIKESVNLQDKAFLRDPIKAKARKRHVSGIREVRKYLIMKKVKLIVIAPNLEKLEMEGSLYDVINGLKSTAQAQNVPYAFALDRYKLGRYTKKKLPVSAFAILSCEGIEELFHKVLDLLEGAKVQFNEMANSKAEKEEDIKTAEINAKVIASFISDFQTELKISDEENDSNLK